MLGNFRGTKFSQTQHLRIFAVLNYSRMQNFKFTDLRLDFILIQRYVILYKLCTEKWLLCLLAWLLVRGTVIISIQVQIVAVDLLQLPSRF